MKRDIFISYKNDGEGNNFAARLYSDLTKRGYSVYFNPKEQHSGDFPERLRLAIGNCKDFILIVSKGCLAQLIQNEEVDWVREEILEARSTRKNIIPLLMPGVSMPKNNQVMPESLRFLPNQDAINMPEIYDRSPFDYLLTWVKSKAEGSNQFREAFNLNPNFNIQNEFEKLKNATECGDLKATYELATLYYYGVTNDDGVSVRDYGKAFDLYMKVYNSNCEYSCYAATMIARMYHDGVAAYGEQSYQKAYAYHKIAAADNGESAQTIAYMKWVGRGCDFDYSETEALYNAYIDQSNDAARMDLASFYKSYGRFQEALDTYNSMQIISPAAEYEMGMIYKSGVLSDPIKPDYFRAHYHFQNAINAEMPYAPAARELGNMYFNGNRDFRLDFNKAKYYYNIGADLGDVFCHYMLGFLYEFGMLKTDLVLSEKHFLYADAHGDINSAHHLAMIYQQPETQNYQKAFEFAKKSAGNGKPEGEYIYALLLYLGRGCEPDIIEAQKYFSRAYGHGYFPAKIMLDKHQ